MKKIIIQILITIQLLYSLAAFGAKPNIHINGVKNEIANTIKNNINESVNLNTSTDIQDLESETKNVLSIYGYYSPNIQIKQKNDVFYISIKTGKPVTIKRVNVNILDNNQYNNSAINSRTDIDSLVTLYKQNLNKPLNQLEYSEFKGKLIQLAHNHGYLDAEFNTHKIKIDKNDLTASVYLELNLNSLYYLNLVNIENFQQADPTKNHNKPNANFIFKFLPYNYHVLSSTQVIIVDTPYSSNGILEFKNSLSRYYSDIKLNTKIDKANNQVNITIKIKPIKNYRYSVGLGYSTDEGARTFGGLQIRNITYLSHKLDLQAKLAQYREIAEANYILPGFSPATDTATIGYQYRSDKKRNNNNLEKERHQVISQYQKSLLSGNMQLTGGLSYRHEEYRDIAKQKSRQSQLLVPYFILDHVATDSRINTNKGIHTNVVLEGANSAILSDSSFVRLHANFKGIYPININEVLSGIRIIGRGQFGQVWHKEQNKIPPTLRFFAGGTETVRGYRYESLGPRELNSKGKHIIVGGDRIAVFGSEIEKTLYHNWSAAVFYDLGNSYDSWSNWRQNLQRGVGFGVRWRSPLGPVRFDVAQAIDKDGKPWRIDFNIGPDL